LFIPRVPASVAERQRPGLSGLRHGERTKAAAEIQRLAENAPRRPDLKSRTALLNMPPHPSYRRRQVRPESGFMPGLANRLAIVRIALHRADCPRGCIARYSLRRKICLISVGLTDVQISLPDGR